MLKIKDLTTGDNVTIPLVVKEANNRETRTHKPYLDLVLFDGQMGIPAKIWDFASDRQHPRKDVVYDVNADVSEWQGNKQLNIKTMRINQDLTLVDFTPDSGYDPAAAFTEAYNLMSAVQDNTLRELAIKILEDLRQLWLTVPGAKTIHHAFTAGTLIHSLSVAKIAHAIAKVTPGANVDLATVGGMLHDVGKLFTYKFEGISVEFTDEGMQCEHVFMGAEFVNNFADNNQLTGSDRDEEKINMLRHIILSHHGTMEYGSPVEPHCIEAFIVHAADSVDANAEMIIEASAKTTGPKWTDRIYAQANKPAIIPSYINALFAEKNNS
jgi:3'-5' exoribonuclease